MNIEDLKRKVRALYRHAKGTTNSMEAMAFADKARELLQAYGDELPDDYEPTSGEEQRHSKRNNSYGPQGETKFDTKKKDQVYSMLLSVTATFYGCDYSVNKESVNEMCIYGSEGRGKQRYLCTNISSRHAKRQGGNGMRINPFSP